MVEADNSSRVRTSGLLVPDQNKLSGVDLAEMFGNNYRRLVEAKAASVGIREKLIFFNSGKPHEGSQAIYIVEQFVGDDLVLVPVLRPNMETSKHHHEKPMLKERYFYIAGESFVRVNGDTLTLNEKQNSIDVPLNVSHQVYTRANPSLTLIIMEKALLVQQGKLHIPETLFLLK